FRPGFFCSINAATAATCGADADVPKKFGHSDAGSGSIAVRNVLTGLFKWSPSSSSKLESEMKKVVLPPSGPVTHGFCRTSGAARRRPRLSKKMGILPADEKSSAQAGLQRADPSGFLNSPNGSAGLSFQTAVAYHAAAAIDAAPCALAWP